MYERGNCTPIWWNATYGTYRCACDSKYKGANCEEGNSLTCFDIHCCLLSVTDNVAYYDWLQTISFHITVIFIPHAMQ